MYKIIVPTDFSDTSVNAIRYGCYLADVTGYDLEIVHVHDGYDGDGAVVAFKGSARIRSRVRERLEKFVQRHADPMTFTGIRDDKERLPLIKCKEVVGNAIPQLIEFSNQYDTALIVMGGVGSGIPSAVTPIFGSVAKGVATRAACPVLLIPQNTGIPKIEHAAIAFDEVKSLLELSEKTDFLRKALAPKMHFTHVLYQDDRKEEKLEQELIQEMFNDFPNYAVDFDLLPEGDITNVLIDYSLERNIDLLILGRHNRGFLSSLLTGSEIPSIVGSSGIPLLILPLTE